MCDAPRVGSPTLLFLPGADPTLPLEALELCLPQLGDTCLKRLAKAVATVGTTRIERGEAGGANREGRAERGEAGGGERRMSRGGEV